MNLFKKMYKMYFKVKMNKKMSYEELYEIIKDGDYPIGKPEISGEGIMHAIRFQPTGKYQIMVGMAGKTLTVSKSYSGVESFAKIAALDLVTDRWYQTLNKENLDGNEAVEVIGEEIKRLLGINGFLV